jgi:mono/diheme cytochrome c family protein
MAARRAFVFTAAISLACAATQYGATDANLDRAQLRAPKGATLFSQQCASCHGERGESASGNAPRVMGEGALPELPRPRNVNADPAAGDRESLRLEARSRPAGAPWRDPFRTAMDLHAFVSKNMPPSAKQREALSADDYWAIVNFVLIGHGVGVPSEGVINETNATSVKLR